MYPVVCYSTWGFWGLDLAGGETTGAQSPDPTRVDAAAWG